MLVFGKYTFQMMFFENIPTNPIKFQIFNFYDIITLLELCTHLEVRSQVIISRNTMKNLKQQFSQLLKNKK